MFSNKFRRLAGANFILHPSSFILSPLPILWRHLLGQYLKVLTLCVVAFLAVLLTTRLEEIARFASTGAPIRFILLFALYQIPYILPIVIPISCLISTIIQFQQMSQTHEITALRSCGFGITQIITPILFAGALMSLLNFYIVSEWATQSHLATRQLQHEIKSINPLVLLQNGPFLKSKGFYINTFGPKSSGESMSDVVIVSKNKHEERLLVFLAKKIEASNDLLEAQNVSLIAGSPAEQSNHYDHLFLENIEKMTLPLQDFSQMMKGEGWRLTVDHLKLPLLFVRTHEAYTILAQAKQKAESPELIRIYQRDFEKCIAEISRRLSVAIAAFAMTLMGASFGITVGRHSSFRGIFYVVGLTALYLACFFCGKSIDHLFVASTLLYTLPLVLILALSLWNLKRISKGAES